MNIYDRLYGKLSFPKIIMDLIDCPALLRLRDVRMANNQFAAFPAFSNTSRYEHSLGVCYLADICSKSLSVSEKDRIELMMACLYHDVGTPPFAHAMEEVLQVEYGFDHEDNLRKLIEGTNNSYIGTLDQVFCGEAIKLHSVCQSKLGRKIGIDVHRISRIIVGDKNEPLSFLLNGNGMDLDNIDNVVRASTAMGIIDSKDCELAKRLASAFVYLDDGTIGYNALYLDDIKKWQSIRDSQYEAIFDSIEDFAYQTMIKKSIKILINDKESPYRLHADSWKLTDSEILYEHLLKNKSTNSIMKNVLLQRPFKCLGVYYVEGNDAASFINTHMDEIEHEVSSFYSRIMNIDNSNSLNRYLPLVVANYYPDKRKRSLRSTAMLMGKRMYIDNKEDKKGALLGLFTSFAGNGYKTITLDNGIKKRKTTTYSMKEVFELMDYLKSKILCNYEVTVYGKRENKRNNRTNEENQLGFF